ISNGAPGIETLLSIAYSEGVARGRLTIERMVDLLSTSPARLYGLEHKGAIEDGRDADLDLYDPTARRTLHASGLHHTSDYTPYEGFELTGAVRSVFVRGRAVIRDGAFVGERGDRGGHSGTLAVLPQVEAQVERRLDDDEDEQRPDRCAEEGDQERAEDDREVEHHHPSVRREHLSRGRRREVLALANVVQQERRAVAEEQGPGGERDVGPDDVAEGAHGAVEGLETGREEFRPGAGDRGKRPEAGEPRQREHEDAVHGPEQPVVDEEEERHPGAPRRAEVERHRPGRRHGPHAAGLHGEPGLRLLPALPQLRRGLRIARGIHCRVEGHVRQRLQDGAAGQQDPGDVPQPDDPVLDPEQDEDREQAPAEEQDADQRNGIGDDEHDRRARGGRPPVEIEGAPEVGRRRRGHPRRGYAGRVRNSTSSSARTSESRISAASPSRPSPAPPSSASSSSLMVR